MRKRKKLLSINSRKFLLAKKVLLKKKFFRYNVFKKSFFSLNKKWKKKFLDVFKNENYKQRFIFDMIKQKIINEKNTIRKKKYLFKMKKKNMLKVSYMLNKYKYYILTIKSFYSNFFLILSDHNNKLVLNYSTGQFVKSNSKKKKLSLITILRMIRKVVAFLKVNKIKFICVHLRTHINSFIFNIFNVLSYNKIKLIYLLFSKPIPHHFGQRKKKARRL